MYVATNNLTGIALDAAVAQALNHTAIPFWDGIGTWFVKINGKDMALSTGWSRSMQFVPSSSWEDAGLIIEMVAGISIQQSDANQWRAEIEGHVQYGSTPLIAAMRCFVESRIGDRVNLPTRIASTVR